MDSAMLTAALNRYAKSDLAKARKHGEIAITDTKRGVVWVRYEGRRYTLTTQGSVGSGGVSFPKIVAEGPLGFVLPVLAALYTVVDEG